MYKRAQLALVRNALDVLAASILLKKFFLFLFILTKNLKDGKYKGIDQYFITTGPAFQSW